MRRATFAVAIEIALLSPMFMLTACPKRIEPVMGTPRSIRLLAEAPERETTQITERREDVEIDTREYDRVPHVVATGETPLFSLDGLSARIYGDEAGTQGFGVDNFVLLEVIADNGKVLDRLVVGFTDGVLIGNERIDNLGRQAFNFEPGEINLTQKLPDHQPFKLRATALDYHGVGRVTDWFLVLRNDGGGTAPDDLKGQ